MKMTGKAVRPADIPVLITIEMTIQELEFVIRDLKPGSIPATNFRDGLVRTVDRVRKTIEGEDDGA